MRRNIAVVSAILPPFALLAACTMQQVQSAPDQTYSETYEERLARYLANPGSFDYSPMEPVTGAPAFTPMRAEPGADIAPEALEQARDYAERSNATAYLVWHDGQIISQYYGPGIDAQTPLVSKSLSKPLSAIAVGRAIELGYIDSLDQKLGDIIPELAGKPKGEILVRHLLDMRSGLIDQNFDMDPYSVWNLAYLSDDHGTYIRDEYPLIDEPGSRYAYSNAVGDFVALVVETASGRRWAEFIGEEILKPIGAVGGEIWVNRPGGLAHSGCCMTMPAESYLRLGVLLEQDAGHGMGGACCPKAMLPKCARARRRTAIMGSACGWVNPIANIAASARKEHPARKSTSRNRSSIPDCFCSTGTAARPYMSRLPTIWWCCAWGPILRRSWAGTTPICPTR